MNISLLSTSRLFYGLSASEIEEILPCLQAKTISYSKDMVIYHRGEVITTIGLVLKGSVNICHYDLLGKEEIIGHVDIGHIFGESYASLKKSLLVEVVSATDSEILFLDLDKLLHSCGNNCSHHFQLIKNLFIISTEKNLSLSKRMLHTSSKSIRSRLMAYFFDLAREVKTNSFTIPFNRKELANYLNVDRSAMCTELTRMQNENILIVKKNTFTLLVNEEF